MTVTEAQAINTLLRYLLGERGPRIPGVSGDTDAHNASRLLADHAYKVLMAGFDSAAVDKRWGNGITYNRKESDAEQQERAVRHARVSRHPFEGDGGFDGKTCSHCGKHKEWWAHSTAERR